VHEEEILGSQSPASSSSNSESPLPSRRDFLKVGSVLAGALVLPQGATIRAALAADHAADSLPLIGAGVVQLFVDNDRVDATQNIRRTYHSVEKHPENPVIRKVEPWETERGTWGSIIYDQDEKIFKAWYGGESGRQKESIPGSLSSCHVLCYATSRDGIHWDRPRLGIYEAFGTKENNVVIGDDRLDGLCHWESLHKDPFDPNPERRYKAIGWSSYDWDGPMSGIYSMCSPDGLQWNLSPEPIVHFHPRPGTNDLGPIGDAQAMMVDTLKKRYVAFLRRSPNRVFSVSEDFVTWTPPAISMKSRDRGSLYNHMGFVYGDHYLGQLSYLNSLDNTNTLMDVWLITSRDGEVWERVDTGKPLIGLGDIGEWDRYNLRLTGAPPIRVGSKLYFYYRHTANRHTPYVGKDTTDKAGGLGLATLRLDGFASVAAGFDGGRLTTKPFRFAGSELQVNAKADFGQLTVEVLDEQGQPLPGFTADACLPMSTDGVEQPICWKESESLAQLKDRPICLRFNLKNVRLYAYRIT
jgi:hypothetical protein